MRLAGRTTGNGVFHWTGARGKKVRNIGDSGTLMSMKLRGKVAVVTGASMGIGEAIAELFAREGATVVLCSRDQGRCEVARQRIGNLDRTLAIACDVRNREQMDALVQFVSGRFGRIDIWVNNAGFGLLDSLQAVKMEDVQAVLEVNLFGALQSMQAVLPGMKRQGSGTIVNISSVAGHIAVPYMAAYSAGKSALNTLSYAARMEFRGTGVSVVNVCPGYIATDFGKHAVQGSQGRSISGSARRVPPERVARAVLKGYLKNRREIIVPWQYWLVVAIYKRCPWLIEWAMTRRAQETDR